MAEVCERGAKPYRYWIVKQNQQPELVEGGIIEEASLSIYVNGKLLATVLCSPIDQESLALGLLYNEGLIYSIDEVKLVQLNVHQTAVDVWLKQADFDPPQRVILTTGCSGGVTFQDITQTHPPLITDFSTTVDAVLERMHDLQQAARLYQLVRGVHTASLAHADQLLFSAEDVGRHNAIDKLSGKALQKKMDTTDCLLLTSGRISSEMLGKAWRMKVPLVVSRTAPTSTAVQLADMWNICIIGYARQGSLRVYTNPQRVQLIK